MRGRRQRERGAALTDPDGLLKAVTKTVIETCAARKRVGCSATTSMTLTLGTWQTPTRERFKDGVDRLVRFDLDVPGDRDGTLEPVIVKKCQRGCEQCR